MQSICFIDPHSVVIIPLTSVQLEFSTTYIALDDCQDTRYATIPMVTSDDYEQLIPNISGTNHQSETHL